MSEQTYSSAELADSIGIAFNDLNLLTLALTHRSYLNEHEDATEDNERLEFLGDAVLDFVVGSYLYRRFPTYQEGELTALRAALVRAETLAQFSKQLGINHYLRLGYGEAESGGRDKIPTLCATFEAVIGAIYLDQGIDAAVPLIERLATPMLATIQERQLHKDAKSEFQVWAQAEFGITPRYEVVAEDGPDHAKEFTVQAVVGKTIWGTGKGRSKRRAAQTAASEALTRALHGDAAADKLRSEQ